MSGYGKAGGQEKLVLTVAQPDMAFYRGPSDEAFDEMANALNVVFILARGLMTRVRRFR